MQANLRAAGFDIITVSSFNQSDDFTVARISSASILNAILAIGARREVDGIFVSCTSLRTLKIIPEAEARIGKPVISSNQALAWHLLRLADQTNQTIGYGRLFSTA
jgi:maleate isomerase